MDKQQLILRIILTITVILGIINLIFIANEFYPNLKPAITDDGGIVEGGKDSSYLIPGFRSIDFEGISILGVYLLVPFLVLYLNFRDYFIANNQGEKLNFAKSFIKGVVASIVIAIIIGIVVRINCIGEECLGVLGAYVIAIGGIILSLIITIILYFKSKKITSINQ